MSLRCDLILRDATIFDGSGAPRFTGDVGVTGDRIVAIGDLGSATAGREIIATGILVADGVTGRIVRMSVAATHRRQGLACGVVEAEP